MEGYRWHGLCFKANEKRIVTKGNNVWWFLLKGHQTARIEQVIPH